MTGFEPAHTWLDSNQQFPKPNSGTISIRSHDALPLSYMADKETGEQLITCCRALRPILQCCSWPQFKLNNNFFIKKKLLVMANEETREQLMTWFRACNQYCNIVTKTVITKNQFSFNKLSFVFYILFQPFTQLASFKRLHS